MLELRNLCVWYGPVAAVSDVTFCLESGRVLALIGPSGCGKSTILRVLNRMVDRTPGVRVNGEVLVDGENIFAPGVDVVALRRRVGMVFQRPPIFPMSIFDNVAYGLRLQGIRDPHELRKVVEESLKQAALWDEVRGKLRRSALGLSGGQQQRLALARALAVRPEVLLMDEPTSALDPMSAARIEDLVVQLKGRYTIVLVTHNLQQAARVSDYTAFLMGGRLIEMAETTVLFTTPQDRRTERYLTGQVE